MKREAQGAPFSVGDVVTISAVRFFGRYATVLRCTEKSATVEVHLTGSRLTIAPSFLSLAAETAHTHLRLT